MEEIYDMYYESLIKIKDLIEGNNKDDIIANKMKKNYISLFLKLKKDNI